MSYYRYLVNICTRPKNRNGNGQDSVPTANEYFIVWPRQDKRVAKTCHQIFARAGLNLKYLAECGVILNRRTTWHSQVLDGNLAVWVRPHRTGHLGQRSFQRNWHTSAQVKSRVLEAQHEQEAAWWFWSEIYSVQDALLPAGIQTLKYVFFSLTLMIWAQRHFMMK